MQSCLSCIVDVPVKSKMRTDIVWNIDISCTQIRMDFYLNPESNDMTWMACDLEKKHIIVVWLWSMVLCCNVSLLIVTIPLWKPSVETFPHFLLSVYWSTHLSIFIPRFTAWTATQMHDLPAVPAALLIFLRCRTVRLARLSSSLLKKCSQIQSA